jgi:3-oxoacyl-[acyl-carrier-protein] synthase II
MQGPSRRVVVTGMGFVTPIGNDVETVWSSVVEGRSGAGPVTRFDAGGYPTRIAAEVRDFDPADHMDRKTARHTSRYCQFALAAARQALVGAALDPAELAPGQVGAIVSSGVGGLDEIERNHRALLERGLQRMSPFAIPMMLTDSAAGLVAIHTGAVGPNYGVVSACASATHGIGEAAAVIARGESVAMLAGGAEACITPYAMGAFCRIRAMSERNDEPERACRPWDVERDGFVMGEGAVVLVLEDGEFARRRGAPALAEVAGCGASADGYHVTAPQPDGAGAERAMRAALAQAGIGPGDVQYVNAHGTSTRLGDLAEARAVERVFAGDASSVLVSSTKSVHGHLLGAAGALEAAVCVLAIQRGLVPPTINVDRQDPECHLDVVPNAARPARVDVAISNSFGFGGHNATLVLRRVEW